MAGKHQPSILPNFSHSSDTKIRHYFSEVGTKLEKTISISPHSSILEKQVQSMSLKPVSGIDIGNVLQK